MTPYRRLDYREYSAWSLLTEIEDRIGTHWRLMQEYRREGRRMLALEQKSRLLDLLEIRRASR